VSSVEVINRLAAVRRYKHFDWVASGRNSASRWRNGIVVHQHALCDGGFNPAYRELSFAKGLSADATAIPPLRLIDINRRRPRRRAADSMRPFAVA
jgi:hypothetical protein